MAPRNPADTTQYQGSGYPASAQMRALQHSDAEALDCILTDWMAQHGVSDAIACDGKTLRGSGSETVKPRHLVAAVVHGTTRIIAQTPVDEKLTDLTGTLVTADANPVVCFLHASFTSPRSTCRAANADVLAIWSASHLEP